jgi:hypothetical protein
MSVGVGSQSGNQSSTTTGSTTGNTTNSVSGSSANVTSGASTSATTNTYDPKAQTAMDSALSSNQYSKSAAISDAEGAADYSMQQVLQAGMPGLSSQDKAAGGYNSTTTAQLDNDLSAKASAAGQSVLLQNITNYANANSNNINATTGAVSATKATSTANTTSGTNSTSTSGTQIGTSASTSASGTSGNSQQTGMGASGSTVICTQMLMDGRISKKIYDADNRYVRNHFSLTTANGYRVWAVPFVRLMRRNKVAYAVGAYIGVRWSLHCAASYTPQGLRNITGWLFCTVVAPICYLIGRVVTTPIEFASLWEGSRYRG